jgi:hypothetical protein
MLRDAGNKKKVKSTLWIVLTSNFKISEKKNKHLSRNISKGCLPKKILEHTTLSFPLLHSAGLMILTLILFEISKK